ncbi:hypothetical protein [Bacillus paramobilis]|uniref:hypothetical protein n=1 Tax=Bacillus paramobilis TaxID=2817477 RepID=UPI001BB4566B|nr:hypothetical protein [Bacillus paramobilis]HEF5065770.1 hypothetical protein [Bacillus cereus]HEF5237754.1 hypothetical protein [Bacillus cereus]
MVVMFYNKEDSKSYHLCSCCQRSEDVKVYTFGKPNQTTSIKFCANCRKSFIKTLMHSDGKASMSFPIKNGKF